MAKRRSHYRAKWRAAIGDHETPTDKARKLIRRTKPLEYKSISEECRRIAAEVKLSTQAVRTLWYEKPAE